METIFKDIVAQKKKEAREIDRSVRTKVAKTPAEMPFFKNISKQLDLGIPKAKKSTNIHQLIPEEAIDTEAPSINTDEFYKTNMKITIENEFMMLKILRHLSEIERYLLYLLVVRGELEQNDEEVAELRDIIKDRLAIFRDPVNQDIYNNEWKFQTEFEISKKYVEQNRAWKK